jgi:hypothetical protein
MSDDHPVRPVLQFTTYRPLCIGPAIFDRISNFVSLLLDLPELDGGARRIPDGENGEYHLRPRLDVADQ